LLEIQLHINVYLNLLNFKNLDEEIQH